MTGVVADRRGRGLVRVRALALGVGRGHDVEIGRPVGQAGVGEARARELVLIVV